VDDLIIMQFVLSFIKVLKISRLFRQDQDQDHFSCPRGALRPRPRSRDYIFVSYRWYTCTGELPCCCRSTTRKLYTANFLCYGNSC